MKAINPQSSPLLKLVLRTGVLSDMVFIGIR